MKGVCIVGCGMWCPCVCTVCCIDGGGDAAGSRLIQFTAMQRDNCPAVSAGCGVNMCVCGRECDHIVDFGRSERTIVRPQARPVFRWMFFFRVVVVSKCHSGSYSIVHTHTWRCASGRRPFNGPVRLVQTMSSAPGTLR